MLCVCVNVCVRLVKGGLFMAVSSRLVSLGQSGDEVLRSGGSHMPLVTPCITISANSALQGNYHQYDIRRCWVNQSGGKVLICW